MYVCETDDNPEPTIQPFSPPESGPSCSNHCTEHGVGQCVDDSDDDFVFGGICRCMEPNVWGGIDCTGHRNLQVVIIIIQQYL